MASSSGAQHRPIKRYSNWAVSFHWITVVLVIAQACLGFAFADAEPGPQRMELFTWHKTVGATILLLTLARLTYRLANPPPPYSPDLPRWEQVVGTWTHRLLYFLLIAMPLTGLIAVSANTRGATTPLIGGIPLPVIPGISKTLGELSGGIHVLLVAFLLLTLIIHAGAALKHQFFDHIPAAGRMPPFQPGHGKAAVIGQGQSAEPVSAGRR